MFKIDTSSSVATMPTPSAVGTPGWFSHGNPALGIPFTVLSSDWANCIQAELLAVLTAAGVTADKTLQNQLLASINVFLALKAPLASPVFTGTPTISGPSGTGANLELAGNGGTTPNKFVRAEGGHFQIVNSAYSVVIADMTDSGALNISGAFATDGNVTAGGASGRLRATLGARGSGDANAGVLLGDYTTSFAGTGWSLQPNGLIFQWGQATTPGAADYTITYPLAFPNNVFSVFGSPVDTASNKGSVDAGGSLTSFAVHLDAAVNFCWFAVGF